MGKIIATARLTNTEDRALFARGFLPEEAVRMHDVQALVDTGSVMLALPRDVVERLGLEETGRTTVVLADERRESVPTAGPLYVELLGREMPADCIVLPPASPALIGQIILERLDLIPDPRNKTLAVRPESPLQPMLDLK